MGTENIMDYLERKTQNIIEYIKTQTQNIIRGFPSEEPNSKYYDPTAPLPPRDGYRQFIPLANATHLLVAGATGSGKSVLLNDLIYTITALKTPSEAGLVLIDPKRVELIGWRDTAYCMAYADTEDTIYNALSRVSRLMDDRYKRMQARRELLSSEHDVYVVIDELADLLLFQPKRFIPLLQHIAQLGRAARIRLIACTQSPSRLTLPATIILNMPYRVALRCDSAIESRQIIGFAGAEDLPRYGCGILKTPDGTQNIMIPLTPPADIQARQAMFRTRNIK